MTLAIFRLSCLILLNLHTNSDIMLHLILTITMIWAAATAVHPDQEPALDTPPPSLTDRLTPDLIATISKRIGVAAVVPFLQSGLQIEQMTRSVTIQQLCDRIFYHHEFDPELPRALLVFTEIMDHSPRSTRLMDSVNVQAVLGLYERLQDHLTVGKCACTEAELLRTLSDGANRGR